MLIPSHLSYSTHVSACDKMKTRYAVGKLVTLLACCILAVLTFTGSSGGEADDERKSNRLRRERYGWPFSERSLHLGLVIVIKSHLKATFTPSAWIPTHRSWWRGRGSTNYFIKQKLEFEGATTVWNDLPGYVFFSLRVRKDDDTLFSRSVFRSVKYKTKKNQ